MPALSPHISFYSQKLNQRLHRRQTATAHPTLHNLASCKYLLKLRPLIHVSSIYSLFSFVLCTVTQNLPSEMDLPTSAHQSETPREEREDEEFEEEREDDKEYDEFGNPLLRLIAPGAKLHSNEQGSYYPLLFNGPPRKLERLIAVPVRPPNSCHIPGKHGSQVKACSSNQIQRGNRKICQAPKLGSGHAVTILDLPLEIILLIFEEVEECLEDLICLGLASWPLWIVARLYLRARYMSLLGKWSGENIMYFPIKDFLRGRPLEIRGRNR